MSKDELELFRIAQLLTYTSDTANAAYTTNEESINWLLKAKIRLETKQLLTYASNAAYTARANTR